VVPFEGSVAEWNALLEKFEGGTFCHLGGWRDVLSEELGHRAHYRIAVNPDGEVRGLLPMVRVKSRLFGDYLVSMPFLSYGGPLGTGGARLLLAQEAVSEAQELGVDLLELRSRTPVPGALRTSQRKLTVVLPLPESPEILWEERFKAKLRSQIRRPMKEGLETRLGSEELDAFYGVFSRTMRRLGTPVLSRGFFESIAAMFHSEVLFCTVRIDEQPLAAGCGFLWDGEFEITWAGALQEFSRMAPNMLLYWAFMQEAIQRGAGTFNFGRCSPDSGTHRFKRQWGGLDEPLPWAQWAPGSVEATPTPKGRKYELATSLWRRLPLPVVNRIGPWLARSLP
jgi:FemAB-related protein (PEP-CTERM system-associated)